MSRSAAGGCCSQFKADPFKADQISQNSEKVFCIRISARTEHSHQAFRRALYDLSQLVEPDGCVDVVAKNSLAGIYIAREHTFGAFAQELSAKSCVMLHPLLNNRMKLSRDNG